jgi:hypothetical protein
MKNYILSMNVTTRDYIKCRESKVDIFFTSVNLSHERSEANNYMKDEKALFPILYCNELYYSTPIVQ